MNIKFNHISNNNPITAMDLYNMTKAPNRHKVSDHVGLVINPKAVLVYDEQFKDDTVTLTSIMDVGGEVYVTNSKTFAKDVMAAYELFATMDAEVPAISIVSGTSKNGRTYITCSVVNG